MKNKKLTSILITVFAVVFMAGSAFAFVSQGPLIFQGTVNVNAELLVEIDAVRVRGNPNNLNVTYGTDGRTATFTVRDFHARGQRVEMEFDIINNGTMPAVVTAVDIDNYFNLRSNHDPADPYAYDFSNGYEIRFAWIERPNFYPDFQAYFEDRELAPLERATIQVIIDFFHPYSGNSTFEGNRIEGYVINTLSIDYAPR